MEVLCYWRNAEGIFLRQGEKMNPSYILSNLAELCRATDRPEILDAATRMLEDRP